jgi:hypothetical protein
MECNGDCCLPDREADQRALEAAMAIQNYCKWRGNCVGCVFWTEEGCYMKEWDCAPSNWEFTREITYILERKTK